jgi:tetratricopeptide (TPR) repeat protein
MLKIILFLFLCVGMNAQAQSLPDEYSQLMFELMNMPFTKKLKTLDKEIKQHPNDPWYYWMKADVYSLMGDDENVRLCFEKSIALDPTFSAGYGSYASYLVYSGNPDYEKAIAYSTKAIALDSTELYNYLNRAEAYLKTKKINEAIADARYFNKRNENTFVTADLVLFYCYRELNDAALMREFLMRLNVMNMSFMLNLEDATLIAGYYESYGELGRMCQCYRAVAENYDLSGSDVPEALTDKLKKCESIYRGD